MSTDAAIQTAVTEFNKAIDHLKDEYSRLQIGRASAAMVENIPVEVYGNLQPLKGVANISIPDPRSLMIQPWDKSNLAAIEKGIIAMNLGLNPVNDGSFIRINFPPLTEERRMELGKRVKQLAEDCRIVVRNLRQVAHNVFKKLKTDNLITEDDIHTADKRLQDKVDEANGKIDELAKNKEKDILTI